MAIERRRSKTPLSVWLAAATAGCLAGGAGWISGAGGMGAAVLAGIGAMATLAGSVLATRGTNGGRSPALTRMMGPNQVRALLDQAPLRIVLKDTAGRYVFLNRSAEAWFGIGTDTALGKHPSEVFPRELAKLYDAADRLVLETDQPQQTQIAHPRGDRVFHSSVMKYPIHADDGAIVGIGAIGTDVTGRFDAERALLDAKEAAERANHLKSAFLAAMSHELRTPLNAIIGFSDLIDMELYGPVGDPRYREYVRDVGASGRHLLGIVNDILDLARIEAGREALNEETIDLEEVIDNVMRTMQVHADRGGVDLRLRVVRALPHLYCDARRVRQILFNLVSNAVKFTPSGGLVTVAARVVGDLEIEVRDTGVGIPAHEIPALFEPFNRVINHLTRGAEGAGLGLALTQRFVQMHGGSISVSSAPGTGTVVTVRLPAARLVEHADADMPG